MVNMVRAPQGGRNWESFGEDPFLQSSIASAYVESMEGIGLMTTLKHFIGNEQEHFREAAGGATVMDYRALNEIYLPPFKAGIEAGASSVMCAYNRLRLTSKKSKAALEAANCTAELEAELLEEEDWSCAHNTAMNGILKGQLGFKG